MATASLRPVCMFGLILLLSDIPAQPAAGQVSPYIYGIHDHEPSPQEYLNHFSSGGVTGWVTATVAVGHNPDDHGGVDFRSISNQGHTVVCRINNAYCDGGTIPLPEHYADFAQRCANFVAASQGCQVWVIGNETNLSVEWPPSGGHKSYVSPQEYADCFVQVYNAIKTVAPTHEVVSQALAPFAGPYGGAASPTICGHTADGVPINWVQYMNQMLSAIRDAGAGPDGIALHINSRGYTYDDIHSTAKVDANGQQLYFSFYVYRDWINLGIPADLYHLPLYATECNGIYYWNGGHEECGDCANPSCCHQPGWQQEIYAEIDRWNKITAPAEGKPVFRCVNMYRWCAYCDGWNIDGSPREGQIKADLDGAVAQSYTWASPPTAAFSADPLTGGGPLEVQFTDESETPYPEGTIDTWSWDFGDQGTSPLRNPVHVYDTPGTYTVSLTVTAASGEDTETRVHYITVVEPAYIGDFDQDDDVDQADFGFFQACLTGSGVGITDPECLDADLSDDGYVDSVDFALFADCFSGARVTPPTQCLN